MVDRHSTRAARRSPDRLRRLVLAAVLLIALGAVILWTRAASAKQAVLTGFDVLTRPGVEAPLRAKLERAGWMRSDLRGWEVEFLLDNQLLGSATTDKDGVARLLCQAPQPGGYLITVRLTAGSAYKAEPDTLLLAVWPAGRRILVTDLDHTLADISALQFLRRQNRDIPTLPEAAETLGELARTYGILYLTARDDAFTRKTREWLQMNGFPQGPLFFWDFLGGPLRHGKFKTRVIADLKKSFERIEVGVGDLKSDAQAYLDNGLQALILSGEHDDDLPEAAVIVKGWHEILRRLVPIGDQDNWRAERQAR